jgi:hypothetical protein
MAQWTMTVSIASGTSSGKFDGESLQTEMEALSLGATFVGFHFTGDVLSLVWSAELSAGDQTTVTTALAAHAGTTPARSSIVWVAGTRYEASGFSAGAITWTAVT